MKVKRNFWFSKEIKGKRLSFEKAMKEQEDLLGATLGTALREPGDSVCKSPVGHARNPRALSISIG